MFFDYVNTVNYGRCVKGSDWPLVSFGVNRVYFINSGKLRVRLGEQFYNLLPGHIYLFPQNQNLTLLLKDDTQVDHTFFDFFTNPIISMSGCIETDVAGNPFISDAAKILFRICEAYPTYPTIIRNKYSRLVDSCLNNLLFFINEESSIGTITDPRITDALQYIHEHYQEEIPLDILADCVRTEKNHFIRLFRRYMFVTPHQYLIRYRLNMALPLLKSNTSLEEIAEKTGYSDAASFSHAFKKLYKASPSQFRK